MASNVGKMASFVPDGIRRVASSAERDVFFPSPDSNQRVWNEETRYLEQYDGANWVPRVSMDNGGRQFDVAAYGGKFDGTTDDTQAWLDALDDIQQRGKGGTLVHRGGDTKVTQPIVVESAGISLLGMGSRRRGSPAPGSRILYYGTGACIQLGTSKVNGAPLFDASYANADYDGVAHGFTCISVGFAHGSPDTPLANGLTPNQYKAGSIAIQDWRGGDLYIRDVQVESFDYPVWGIQSDLNNVEGLIMMYCHSGVYLGPRSDQNNFIGFYGFNNDRMLWLDRCTQAKFVGGAITASGTSTQAPVRIGSQYSTAGGGHAFFGTWFEMFGIGATSTNIPAFVDVGVGDSVTTKDVHFYSPTILTNQQIATGHAHVFVRMDNARKVVIHHPTGDSNFVSNIGGVMESLSATVNNDCLLLWDADSGNTLATRLINTGGNTAAAVYEEIWGTGSARQFRVSGGSGINGRLYVTKGNNNRDFFVSSEGDGQLSIAYPNDGSGNTTRFFRNRRDSMASAAPTSLTWAQGDYVRHQAPAVGTPAQWSCTSGGTPGTWIPTAMVPGMSADQGDTSVTWTPGTSATVLLYNTPLTTGRTVTLSATGAWHGARVRVVRTAAATGASTLTVGAKTLAAGQFVEHEYNSTLSAYVEIGFGSL